MTQKKNDPTNFSPEFLNNFIHEIAPGFMMARNVRGLIETSKLSAEDQELLKESEERVEETTQKMDRILEACQWDMGAVSIDPKIIQVQTIFPSLKEKYPNIMLHFEQGSQLSFLQVDEVYFLRALEELVKNSFFFHGNKSPSIDITVKDEQSSLLILIRDNGIGIDKKYHEQIFKLLFVVSPSRNETESGAGVGLFLAQKIIHAHGGEIIVKESFLGKGTTFKIRMPKPLIIT